MALADHWLFSHGLNFFGRLLLFGVWMAAAGWFTWRAVAPSIMHRINPVFAAQAIEHGRPTLKNSLINFLLLRSHPENVAPVVYQAMEHRAATDLSRVPIEQAVDHRRFIHLCYVLAAAVVLFALYVVLSPKNPLVSAARVMFPWMSLPARRGSTLRKSSRETRSCIRAILRRFRLMFWACATAKRFRY